MKGLKNNDRNKEILVATKIIKSKRQWKNLQDILTSSLFGEHISHGVTISKNKISGVCKIILEGKSYAFENHKTIFLINKNVSCDLENLVNVIQCNKFKKYS